jgi:hypothetical protein
MKNKPEMGNARQPSEDKCKEPSDPKSPSESLSKKFLRDLNSISDINSIMNYL